MNPSDMKEKPVFRLLLQMSLPMVISMAVSSLYNIIDSFFVARISEDALTALSLIYPLQNLVNAVTIGFGIGMNAVISYYLGAQQQEEADKATTQGFLLSLVHGLFLMIACLLCCRPFLSLFTSSERVLAYGLQYSHIVFCFAVFVSAGMAFEKIYQAVGKMSVTMVCILAGCVTNLILDPILIFGPGPFPALEIQGAALATGIGQVVTLLVYLVFYAARPLSVRLRVSSARHFSFKLLRRIYAVGIPAMLNMALASVLVSALNGILSAYSQIYVVVLGVYYKLQTFLYLPANGVIQGMRPLIGYNSGAKEQKRVRKIFVMTLLMISVLMAAGTILCQTVPAVLIGLFTSNAETIRVGSAALRIISCGFILSTISVTCCGALEGLGRGFPSLIISVCRYILLILPAAFLLTRFAGPDAIWHAFWITELLSAVVSGICFAAASRTDLSSSS